MKISKLSLFLLFILLLLVSLVIVSQKFQEQENKEGFSNVTLDNISAKSFKSLGNKTPLKGEFTPILTLSAWDFQGFGNKFFAYTNSGLSVYDLETGKIVVSITPVYDYYFSNGYAYIKTDNGSFVLDYKTLRLEEVNLMNGDKYVFRFNKCVIRIREKSSLINGKEFKFSSTPKIAFFNNSFVIFGLVSSVDEKIIFFDKRCNLLKEHVIPYMSDFKVLDDKIFFIDRKLYSKTLPKFPELEGEMIMHEYLKEAEVYLFADNGTLIVNLTLSSAIGFYNNTIYTIYPHGIGKFYLSNKSLEKKVVDYVLYPGWAVVQGVYGDFTKDFMSFVYWGFSGEAGTPFSGICVYPYEKTIKCTPYYSETKRVNPIDEIKAWSKYFAIVPRGTTQVIIYEVR